MKFKKILAFCTVSLIIILGINIPSTHAQSSKDQQIPSDLALDLDLANKNPTPNQKLISDVQTEKAQITTSKGEQVVIPVKEAVPAEAKTQSSKDAENPAQTTSEQVIEKNVEEKNGQNNNGAINNGQNVIPGTNLPEPDDNTAPTAQPSANPTGNSDQQQGNSNVQSSPADTGAPNAPAPTEQTNTIPLENGTTQPGVQPAEILPPPTSETPPSSENSPAQPVDGSGGGGLDNSGGDGTSVQGVSTVSWWQIFLNQVSKVFKK